MWTVTYIPFAKCIIITIFFCTCFWNYPFQSCHSLMLLPQTIPQFIIWEFTRCSCDWVISNYFCSFWHFFSHLETNLISSRINIGLFTSFLHDYSPVLLHLMILKKKKNKTKPSETQILGAQDFPVEYTQYIFIWSQHGWYASLPDII